jgi:hypothetical protein
MVLSLINQTTAATGKSSSPPLTLMSPSSTWTTIVSKRKLKLIRKSAQAVQKFWVNKLAASDHAKFKKRNAFAAVLDFTDNDWEVLTVLKEADAAERSQVAVANDIDNNTWALGMVNGTIGGKYKEGEL